VRRAHQRRAHVLVRLHQPLTPLLYGHAAHAGHFAQRRRETLAPALDLVVVQSAIYGEPDANGVITGDGAGRAMLKNDPSFMMYNGRLTHDMLAVEPGDLVREVNSTEVQTLAEFRRAASRARRSGRLVLLVQRGYAAERIAFDLD